MSHTHEDTQSNHPLEGRYANYFQIGYNAFEFLLDFGQFYSENETMLFHTRIITNPVYVKVLFALLQESIVQYEQTYRVIPKEEE